MSKDIGNVVTIFGDEVVPPGVPRPDLIKMVEDLLEATRSGKVAGIAWAYLYDDDATSHNYGGKVTRSLIGAIEDMKFGLITEYRKRD